MSIYLKAIDVLNERGWYQGNWCDVEGKACCVLGAINVALGFKPTGIGRNYPSSSPLEDLHKLNRAYTRLSYTVKDSVADWNDALGRTKEEVIEALRKAHEYECERVAATAP